MGNCNNNKNMYVRPSRHVECVETVEGGTRREGEAIAWKRVKECAELATRLGYGDRFGYWPEYQSHGVWRIMRKDRSIPEPGNGGDG